GSVRPGARARNAELACALTYKKPGRWTLRSERGATQANPGTAPAVYSCACRTSPEPWTHVQAEARAAYAAQDALRHARRGAVPRPRHRRQHGDLLDLRPDAASAAAGEPSGAARELRDPRSRPRLQFLQPGRRLRRGPELSHAQGSPEGAQLALQRRRGPSDLRREHRLREEHADQRRGDVGHGELLPDARAAAGAGAAAGAVG